jgi:hypothetical protein
MGGVDDARPWRSGRSVCLRTATRRLDRHITDGAADPFTKLPGVTADPPPVPARDAAQFHRCRRTQMSGEAQ